jgi:cysteine desulfurase
LKLNVDRLYLDYNATSPLSHSVLDWVKSGDLLFANPASQHSSGKASRKIINETRALVFKTFGKAESDTKLFFHSGATEAMMTFAYSFSEWARLHKREVLICYSKIDHPAVTSLSERYFGEHVEFMELSIDQKLEYQHELNLSRLIEKKKEKPHLVILYHHLWVHNETGLVSPLTELERFKSIPDLFLHVDAVQAPGKIVNWRELLVGDIFSFSAHKFGAFKGLGFSFFKKDMPFAPFLTGGGQQQGLRSGTENPQAVMSLSLALKDLVQVDVKKNSLQRQQLESFLKKELAGLGEVITHPEQNSNTIYFYLNSLSSDIALALFDLEGMEISAGSACSSGAAKASIILTHMGLHSVAKNGLRLSFGFELSDQEREKIQQRLERVLQKLTKSLSSK